MKPITRRRFLHLLTASATLPLWLQAAIASALSEDDPVAQALGYKADNTQVHDPAFKAGSNCANCLQYQTTDTVSGACPLFPGKAVNATGWCKAWVKKP